MTINYSPVNISYGNTARFVVEFLSSLGVLTVPSSATLTITYVNNVSLTSTSTNITLTQTNSFFLATWSSTGAVIGMADWSISAPGITSPAATGQIRVIDIDG